MKKERKYYAVYYPDGDYKCVVKTLKKAKKESEGYGDGEDIRIVSKEKAKELRESYGF